MCLRMFVSQLCSGVGNVELELDGLPTHDSFGLLEFPHQENIALYIPSSKPNRFERWNNYFVSEK